MIRVLHVFGTRPEAIKLCPLVLHLRTRPTEFDVSVCVTGQHRGMLDSVLGRFGISPEYDLNVMVPNQSLPALAARILQGLERVLAKEEPDFILVQGDTTTTLVGALAGFYTHIAVGHVEAGLRTGDIGQPFPEEMNRVVTTRLSALHFAPTKRAHQNLVDEGVPSEQVFITGNTGIDALLYTRDRLERGEWRGYEGVLPPNGKKLILVTAHRRESFGEGIESICTAIKRIAARGDVEVVYPVHPNPNVRSIAERELNGVVGVRLIEPLDYVPFVDLMRRASIILTDSGGVQEEAPSLEVPVLVLRSKTERQEAIEAGTAQLVGTDPEVIVAHVNHILASNGAHTCPRANPFGDGRACELIGEALLCHCGSKSQRAELQEQWVAWQHR
jgi:UDP-N-acetylglucosamine 2-epimerase (non-hydrolysing)